MPLLSMCLNYMVIETVWRLWNKVEISSNPTGRRYWVGSNDVPLYALREKAHSTKDSYYLKLLNEADELKVKADDRKRRAARLALATVLLFLADLYYPFAAEAKSITQQLAQDLGEQGYAWAWIFGCLLLAIAFYPIFEDDYPVVYCPRLAREREQEDKERRERDDQFRAEMHAKLRESRRD
jgi:hypothetical protein